MGQRGGAGVVFVVVVVTLWLLPAGLCAAQAPAPDVEPPLADQATPPLTELPLAALRAAAEAGSPDAQVALAEALSFPDDDTPPDDAAAAGWLRRAAEQGHAEAQHRLGLVHYAGRGVERDRSAAAAWWRRAAEQKHPEAEFWLGWVSEWGFGVERDEAASAAWYRRAAEQGHASAQASLGGAYAQGKGVPRDDAEAVRWYRLAAEQHEASAQYGLGEMLAAGRGVERDEAEAVRWYGSAAEQGFTAAQTALAMHYLAGRGVATSYVCAYLWAGLAAEAGFSVGADMRDGVAEQLAAADLAEAKRLLAASEVSSGVLLRPLCPGETVSLSLGEVTWGDLAGLFRMLTGLEVVVPPGASGNLAVEIADVPWETALSSLLAGTGHGWRRDGDRLLIEPLAPAPD